MFEENLKKLRKEKGLSQQEVALRLHVVRQTVSKWEQGLSVPDADLLVKLADVLEIDVSHLLCGEADRRESRGQEEALVEQLVELNRGGKEAQGPADLEGSRNCGGLVPVVLCAAGGAGQRGNYPAEVEKCVPAICPQNRFLVMPVWMPKHYIRSWGFLLRGSARRKRKKAGRSTAKQRPGRKSDTVLHRLRRAFVNPFAVILLVLASISLVTDVFLASNFSRNMTTAIIILGMLFVSGIIRFIQEPRAKRVADRLTEMIASEVLVRRMAGGWSFPPMNRWWEIMSGCRLETVSRWTFACWRPRICLPPSR